MTTTAQPSAGTTAIRPFTVEIPESDLDDLRRRLAAVRLPGRELVDDRSQGVQLATIRELVRYWGDEHDWRACEARLNALPQFITEIDGVDVHFIHVTSPHADALPLLMTHGWPGSVIELLDTVGPLTDPTAHGGSAGDAFHLVLPSLPGYGFSGEPAELGWDTVRIARAWAALMGRLGYTRYVAQGGDVGADVTDALARQSPEGLIGVHVNLLTAALAIVEHLPAESGQERAAHEAVTAFHQTASATSWSSPPGRRRSVTHCWTHPSGWRPGCSTTTRTPTRRSPARSSTARPSATSPATTSSTTSRCTGSPAPAPRPPGGTGSSGGSWPLPRRRARPPPPAAVPVAFTAFPGELWAAPRSWAEAVYPGLAYYNAVDRGGHFAAWEEPQLFSSELRAAFRPLR